MAKLALLMLALAYSVAADECQDCTDPASDETSLLQAHVKLHDRVPTDGETLKASADPEYVAQNVAKVAGLQEAKVMQTSSPVEDATTGQAVALKAETVEDSTSSTGGKTTELTKKESSEPVKKEESLEEDSKAKKDKEDSKDDKEDSKKEKEDSKATKESSSSELKAASVAKALANEIDSKLDPSKSASGYFNAFLKAMSPYLLQLVFACAFYIFFVDRMDHGPEKCIFGKDEKDVSDFSLPKFSKADKSLERGCSGASPYSHWALYGCLSAGAANIVFVFCPLCTPFCIPLMVARTIHVGYKFRTWGYSLGCGLMTLCLPFWPCVLAIYNAKYGHLLDGGLWIYRQETGKWSTWGSLVDEENAEQEEDAKQRAKDTANKWFVAWRVFEAICCMPCAIVADAAKVDAMYGNRTGFLGVSADKQIYDKTEEKFVPNKDYKESVADSVGKQTSGGVEGTASGEEKK